MDNIETTDLSIREQTANAAYVRVQCVKSAPAFDPKKPFAVIHNKDSIDYYKSYDALELAAIEELKIQLQPIRDAIEKDRKKSQAKNSDK